MNLLATPIITNKGFAKNFQDQYLDIGSLIHFSSVSRITYAAYRDHLMRRVLEVFSLAIEVPIPEDFRGAVMDSLKRRLIRETSQIVRELTPQLNHNSDEKLQSLTANKDSEVALACRRKLFLKITTFCQGPNSISSTINRINAPAWLYFLLSCGRRLSDQYPKARDLHIQVIGRLLANGCVHNGRFLDAWNCLKAAWPKMNGCEQAKVLLAIGHNLYALNRDEMAAHRALPIVRAFVSDTSSGWADDTLRMASSYLIESHLENSHNPGQQAAIYRLFEEIAAPLSYCQFKPILDLYCEVIREIMDPATDDWLKNILQDFPKKLERVKLPYLNKSVSKISAQKPEQCWYESGFKLVPIRGLPPLLIPEINAYVDGKQVLPSANND